MASTTCKNCGGEKGLHHYQTMQCPVGGREANIGRHQEWMTTSFQPEEEEIERLRATIERLERDSEFAICAYCGERVEDTQRARLNHIMNCENRPERVLLSEIQKLRGLLNRAEPLLSRAKRVIQGQSLVPHVLEDSLESLRVDIESALEGES